MKESKRDVEGCPSPALEGIGVGEDVGGGRGDGLEVASTHACHEERLYDGEGAIVTRVSKTSREDDDDACARRD